MKKACERRCRECGKGTLRQVTGPGRTATFRFLELEVPSKVRIPTCDKCGAQWHNDTTAAAFDSAMEEVFRAELMTIAQRALERIESAGVRQSEVERAIGLSAGYLSKIKRRERMPEPLLVAQLAMISIHPAARLAEAVMVWSTKLAG